MRVLLSGYTCDPNGGSEAANTWYTALELARAGAEVHLLTRLTDKDRVDPSLKFAQHEGLPLSLTYLSDHVPRKLSRRQLGVYARYAAFQWRVRRWTVDRRFDIGHHVSWGSVSHPVGLAGAIHPLVIGPVGGGQSLQTGLEAWMGGELGRQRARRLLLTRGSTVLSHAIPGVRSADMVLVTNYETEVLARTKGARAIMPMVADGVRRMPAAVHRPPNGSSVVWIGRFLPIKGASLALAAFRECLRGSPEAELCFVGDGPERPRVEYLSRDLQESGSVRFVGALDWDSGQEILRSARIHLFTGLRDSFSAQTLEAAAAGTPTVALDQYGLRMFCRRSGFLLCPVCPASDLPNRLGVAMSRALGWSESRWMEESRAAKAFAAEHTYQKHAAQLLSLYEDLLS